jgi:protein involved in polysaccharide export with SLBB domain
VNTKHFSNFVLKIQFMKTLHALFLFGLFFFAMPAFAQLPADQGFLIKAELDKRGLSEAEADAALIAEGLDIKKMSPEEALINKGAISKVLDDLAETKKLNIVENQESKDSMKVEEQILKPDNQVKVEKDLPKTNPIYGHQLFQNGGLQVQANTDGASAPETYVLGAGDQIRITIFGISQADLLMTINESGFVAPAGMVQIYLKGLTLKEARKVVRNRFSLTYRFQNDEFAVTLQKARMLNVNIFGEVVKGGSVQLSALNTALNALMAAGGVSEIGSVRHIELLRGDIRKKIDLYAFLNNPSVQFQYDLQHNDILYVPVAQKVVSLEGAVKRPMRYELAGTEGLKELLAFAGGVLYNANAALIQVERQTGEKPQLTEYSLADVLSGKVLVDLLDGDIVILKPSSVPLEQFAAVQGAVYYPGQFAWKEGLKLSEVLEKAKLKPQTSTELYMVKRTLTDGTQKVIKVVGKDAISFELFAKDSILVFDQSAFANQLPLEVSGAVRAPFKQNLAYTDQIKLSEALALAKGTLPTTADWAYVRRPNLFVPNEYSYTRVNLNENADFALGAGDVLMVYDKEIYTQAADVSIGGAVRTAYRTPFSPELSIKTLIEMAGRTTEKANLKRVDLFRLVYNDKRGSGYELIRLSIDSNYNVVGYPGGYPLLPFDQIMVRQLTLFDIDKMVTVTGEVKFPGDYALPASQYRLSDLITDAGGINGIGSMDGAIIMRTFNNVGPIGISVKKALRHKNSKKYNPYLLSGDVLTIYPTQNTFSLRLLGTNYPIQDSIIQTSSKSFIYDGKKSARWYIREYAGGLSEDANPRSVAVAYPNGQVDGTRRSLYLFNKMPTVRPGGQIIVSLQTEKEKAEKKEIDYDAIFSRSFQAISSILTITLLLKQL